MKTARMLILSLDFFFALKLIKIHKSVVLAEPQYISTFIANFVFMRQWSVNLGSDVTCLQSLLIDIKILTLIYHYCLQQLTTTVPRLIRYQPRYQPQNEYQ